VAHACNPGYSGGRDLEDCGSKPAVGKYFLKILSWKNPSQKRAGGVAQGERSEFKSSTPPPKKKKKIFPVLAASHPSTLQLSLPPPG
jgi:hypothetical protein